MISQEYPCTFARFYDLIYHKQRDGVDNGFFLQEIKDARGKILETGVGTGRLFVEALSSGADIYGIDISQSMIDVLNSKLNDDQKKRITRQNIIDFKLNTTFDLIIAPFRVIMHLTDKVDQLKALNNIYAHLNPGGKFIFDAFVPDLGQLLNGIDNVTDFEGEYEPGKKIRRIVTSTPDLINQIILVRFNLEWEEEDNKRQEIWEVPLRFFFRYELEHLVERSDFRDYKITGDYLGNELNKTSRDFIITCIK